MSAPLREEIAIRVENVTVSYRSYHARASSLKESLIQGVRSGTFKNYSTFDALSRVSFQVPRGSVFGLVGSNGSGKSTLLKVLARVLVPTRGSVNVQGSVASLIELGAGFDPELNAIENIYLNGSLHRKSKEFIRERIPRILEFAELSDFALTPIKYYSSGMYARLGFSVAIDIDPDILLVDEILGVGDERFQLKCKGVFEQFIAAGKTIVMVSHDLPMIADTANRVVLLSKGHVMFEGDPKMAIDMYRHPHYQTALRATT